MTILKIYTLGAIVTFTVLLLTEIFYFCKGSIKSVTIKDCYEDLLLSLTSWIGIILIVIFFIGEYKANFNLFGYGKYLSNFKDNLIRHSNKVDKIKKGVK